MSSLRARADAAAQVLVDDLEHPALDEVDAHHLRRALRLRAGEPVVACDGAGSWRLCALARGDVLEPTTPVTYEPPRTRALEVWLPAVKGDRAEWAVAKLTELGVDTIGLLRCERASVQVGGDVTTRVLARWGRVAREAACQSRRTRLPHLDGPLDVAALAARGVVRCDLDGERDDTGLSALMVGPEGGWSDAERAAAAACVSLSDGVLRTETAAVVAGARLAEAARHGAVLEAQ